MRSRAHFRSHPLHPILIPFPIAFLLGGFIADVAGALLENPDLVLAAWYMIPAGIATGILAAIPGLVDYRFTVPPRSSAKTRATRHMLVNGTALLVFAFVWWLRGGPGVTPELVLLVIEGCGALLLVTGGWMGGTLVHRNQIGTDHRYARGGKWSEQRISRPASEATGIVIATVQELETDQMKLLHVGGRRIVLTRSEVGFLAFSDRCPHRGGSLAGGVIACGVVTCPWHGSQFDVRSGGIHAGPATEAIETFPVRTEGNDVILTLPGV